MSADMSVPQRRRARSQCFGGVGYRTYPPNTCNSISPNRGTRSGQGMAAIEPQGVVLGQRIDRLASRSLKAVMRAGREVSLTPWRTVGVDQGPCRLGLYQTGPSASGLLDHVVSSQSGGCPSLCCRGCAACGGVCGRGFGVDVRDHVRYDWQRWWLPVGTTFVEAARFRGVRVLLSV